MAEATWPSRQRRGMHDTCCPTTCCSRPAVRAKASARSRRVESERFKRFDVNELLKRDKLNLDILWLKDEPGRCGSSAAARRDRDRDRREPAGGAGGVPIGRG